MGSLCKLSALYASRRPTYRSLVIDQDQLRAFAQALQRLSILFMRIAVQQSSAHETYSKQEMLTLGVLGVRGACRMGEIAEHLGVVQSAAGPSHPSPRAATFRGRNSLKGTRRAARERGDLCHQSRRSI